MNQESFDFSYGSVKPLNKKMKKKERHLIMDYELDMNKYKFYHANGKTIAVSSYCKKPVRGVAKCDERDTFDPGIGEKLAAARCNAKVTAKRFHRAQQKFKEAEKKLQEAQRYYDDMKRYSKESFYAKIRAGQFLEFFEDSLNDSKI